MMARKTSKWAQTVREALRRLGLSEAQPAPQFTRCEHVCVEVAGLGGYAVIHQRDAKLPFGFCVFEPNTTNGDEAVEVFERTMTGLDELPVRIAEWKAFRQSTEVMDMASANAKHLEWLLAVAVNKKNSIERLNETRRHRLAGDLAHAWTAAGFVVKVPSRLGKDVPPLAAERLIEDLNSVAPDLLAWHLDRDEKGKPFLKRRVPLFRYDRDLRKRQSFCLIVALPEKRSGRPEIRAEWLDADAQTVRLDATPELFDIRVAANFCQTFFSTEASKVRGWCDPESKSRSAFMATLRDQCAGRFEEAAARANLELDPSILDCLRARRVAHMCTCCAPLDKQLTEWSTVLRQALLEANLPHVAILMRRGLERTNRWPRSEPIPILPFPMQRHIQKAHLAVCWSKTGTPQLCIHTTGSGNRVPFPVWRRSVDFDLLRAGLLTREEFPISVVEQFGLGSV